MVIQHKDVLKYIKSVRNANRFRSLIHVYSKHINISSEYNSNLLEIIAKISVYRICKVVLPNSIKFF